MGQAYGFKRTKRSCGPAHRPGIKARIQPIEIGLKSQAKPDMAYPIIALTSIGKSYVKSNVATETQCKIQISNVATIPFPKSNNYAVST